MKSTADQKRRSSHHEKPKKQPKKIATDLRRSSRPGADPATAAPRASSQQWHAAFDAMNDSICLIDRRGKILRCNRATARLLGKPVADILGRHCWQLVHGTAKPIEDCPILRMKASRHREHIELPMGKRWFSVTVDPVFDNAGRLIEAVHIMSDITERRRAEKALRKAQEDLEMLVRERTAELMQSNRQLRNLAVHLQTVREEERKHISREIHDELGQMLTALNMDLAFLGRRAPVTDKSFRENIELMVAHVSSTIQMVRRLCAELRPKLLDDFGLAAAIEWHAKSFQERTHIRCRISLHPGKITLDEGCSTAIYRILQESLTNVVRHSDATVVTIRLRREADEVILRVRDNGKGFARDRLSDPDSFGLIGMKERALSFGGAVSIESVRGKGTTVTARFPLRRNA